MKNKSKQIDSKPEINSKDEYYRLASYADSERIDAAAKICEETENSDEEKLDYTLSRLIKGLASSRAASRIGFSVALTELIKTANSETIIETVLKSIKSLKDGKVLEKDSFTNIDFGQALACLALAKGIDERFVSEQVLGRIIDMALQVYNATPYLQHFSVQTILCLASKCEENKFTTSIFPKLKQICCNVTMEKCDTNILWLIFGLRKLFPDFINKKCPLASLEDENTQSDCFSTQLTQIITKSANFHPTIHPGIVLMFERAFEDDRLTVKMCEKVLQNGLLKHENQYVVVYTYRLIDQLILCVKTENQISSLLSPFLFEHALKSLMSQKAAIRLPGQYATQLLYNVQKCITHQQQVHLTMAVLKSVFKVALDFDRMINVRFVMGLMIDLAQKATANKDEALKEKAAEAINGLLDMIFEKAQLILAKSDSSVQVVQYVMKIFGELFTHLQQQSEITMDKDSRWKILSFLMKVYNENEKFRTQISAALKSILASLYNVNLSKPGEMSTQNRSILRQIIEKMMENPEFSGKIDQNLLKKVQKCMKKLTKKFDDQKNEVQGGFEMLLAYLTCLEMLQPTEYANVLEEAMTCYKEYCSSHDNTTDAHCKPEDNWLDVLIDLVLSLLSKNDHHFRQPLELVMSCFVQFIKPKHLAPILKVLNVEKSDEVLDDSDGEMSDVEENGKSDDDESEGEISEHEAGEEKVGDANQALEKAVEEALINANAMETESVHSDISDETMLRLDSKLADVFKLNTKSSQAKGQANQEAQSFRMRCFDLLLVLIHQLKDPGCLLYIVPELLNSTKQAMKFDSQQSFINRSIAVFNKLCVLPLKRFEDSYSNLVTVENVNESVSQIFKLSTDMPNVEFQKLCSDGIRFCVKLAEKTPTIEATALIDMLVELIKLNLDTFMTQPDCMTSEKLFVVLFDLYPEQFCPIMISLPTFLTDKSVRMFRKMDCLRFMLVFLRHFTKLNFKPQDSTKKLLAKFAKHMLPILAGSLDQLYTKIIDKSESQKLDIEEDASKLTFTPKLVPLIMEMMQNFMELKRRQILEPKKLKNEKIAEICQKMSSVKLYQNVKKKSKGKKSETLKNLLEISRFKPQKLFKKFQPVFGADDEPKTDEENCKEPEEKKKKVEEN